MSSTVSRSSTSSSTPRSSRSATPRSRSYGASSFFDNLYSQKTFNLLVGLSVLFFIVILSFLLFDVRKNVRSPICNCGENQYYHGQNCVDRPTELEGELYTTLLNMVQREIVNCSSLHELKEILDPEFSQYEIHLPAFIYATDHYVGTDGNIYSCTIKESNFGNQVAVIFLFIICSGLAVLSFLGRNSKF